MTEKALLENVHELLSKAEIVVAHNGDAFDVKKLNARFMVHRMSPPQPFLTIDTKKEIKKIASFDSHSLNNLGIDLSEGEKIKHRGFDMWEGCMAGVKRDWADMKRYNKQDVDLLEKIYLRIRPWIKNHPRINPGLNCNHCNSSNLMMRGTRFINTRVYQRFQCKDCGGWSKSAKKS